MPTSIFRKIRKIFHFKFVSCFIYYVKPGGIEGKHFHKGLEIVYVIDGNCKTHRKGKIYFYRNRQIHEMVNDSKKELVVAVLNIPPESKEITVFI